MTNRLDQTIAQHRKRLREIDQEALGEVFNAYQDVMTRIEPMIERVQQAANDQGVNTPDELFRMDRYQELQRQLLREMDTLARATGNATQRAQVAAIQETMGATQSMAMATARGTTGSLRVGASWVRLPVQGLEDLVGATQSGPLRELLNTLGDTANGSLTQELINGLATGQGPRKIAEAMHRAMDIPRNRAMTIARTETFRAQRGAAQRAFAANDDILKGWYWTAAHQTRTCAACLAMDGTLLPVSEKLRGHPNCRCAMRPALKDLPEREIESGEEWLRSQSPKDQDAVLGKQGGAAWRAGDVELKDFVRVDESEDWGPSTRDGGIKWARANATARGVPQTTALGAKKVAKPKSTAPEEGTVEAITEKTQPMKPAHRLEGSAPRTVLDAEDRISAETTESGHAFTADGELLFVKGGDASQVSFTEAEVTKLKGGILTHNHPGNSATGDSGFSDNDIFFAVGYDLAEIRAVTTTGKRYSLKRPAGGWGADLPAVRAAYDEAKGDVLASYRSAFLAGKMTKKQAEARVQGDIAQQVADRFGWDHSEVD